MTDPEEFSELMRNNPKLYAQYNRELERAYRQIKRMEREPFVLQPAIVIGLLMSAFIIWAVTTL